MTARSLTPGKALSLHHLVREAEPGAERPPLLLLMHGIGSDERDLAQLAPALDPRLLVLSARAPNRLDRGFAWYHMEYAATGFVIDEAEAEESRRRIIAFLGEATAAYGADASRVYIGGFSQGAIMSLSVALTEPELVAGVVAMSARILPQFVTAMADADRLAGLPLLVVHGLSDVVIPIAYGRDIRDRLSRLPVALDYREYPMAHQISAESLSAVQQWLADRLDAPARQIVAR
ncbi:MAG: phospholipase [Gemmatimonadaceae bacterium]